MNNACPGCGAVYAVTAKDIGRKIRCKKCSTALRVDDTGLVVDAPSAAAPALPPPQQAHVPASIADDDDAPVINTRGKKDKRPYERGTGGSGDFLAKIGGIPTILFSIGVFLVIWFTFMTPIGEAAIARAEAAEMKLLLDQAAEMKKTKGDADKIKKITEDYEKKLAEAKDDANAVGVSNTRSVWFEKYGQLFGFLFLAFGCIGYLRTQQPPIIHYVAGFILAMMMMIVFVQAGGCSGAPKLPNMSKASSGRPG